MKKVKLLFASILFLTASTFAQKVGVNTTTPNASAILDVTATNKGMLVPRVSLTSSTDVTTIPTPAVSLLVYNTTAAGTAPQRIEVGFHYWDGALWQRLKIKSEENNPDWGITGNKNTNPTTNFIGTTDNAAFATRTNDVERMRVLTNGNVGIGTTNPAALLTVAGNLELGSGVDSGAIGVSRAAKVANFYTPNAVKTAISATPETALRLIRPGTAGQKWSMTADMQIGSHENNVNSGTMLNFRLGNGGTNVPNADIMTLQGNGRVGINVTAPRWPLEVAGGPIALSAFADGNKLLLFGTDTATKIATSAGWNFASFSGSKTAANSGNYSWSNVDANKNWKERMQLDSDGNLRLDASSRTGMPIGVIQRDTLGWLYTDYVAINASRWGFANFGDSVLYTTLPAPGKGFKLSCVGRHSIGASDYYFDLFLNGNLDYCELISKANNVVYYGFNTTLNSVQLNVAGKDVSLKFVKEAINGRNYLRLVLTRTVAPHPNPGVIPSGWIQGTFHILGNNG